MRTCAIAPLIWINGPERSLVSVASMSTLALLPAAFLAFSGLLSPLAFGQGGGAELLTAKGCLGCHAMDRKVMGPAFRDVAAKYKGDAGAEAKLVSALKEGKGHPVKAAATDAELKAIVG